MNVLAIIPARGGSKGIPRKNIRIVADKPLIAHTIEQALQTPSVTRVVVSTDDDEIAAVARRFGAEVVMRPADISGDTASSESALLYTLDFLKETEHYEPELLVFLQCTAPLTLAEDIEGTIQALLTQQADTALAATPFYYFIWQIDAHGQATGVNHDARFRPRRQDIMNTQFLETGAVYVMRAEQFKAVKHRFFGKTALYAMPEERTWEIDTVRDLEVADVLLKKRQGVGNDH